MLGARIVVFNTLDVVLVSTAHPVPSLCCLSLNEPSRLDSGASPSLAALVAAQGRYSLIITGAGQRGMSLCQICRMIFKAQGCRGPGPLIQGKLAGPDWELFFGYKKSLCPLNKGPKL